MATELLGGKTAVSATINGEPVQFEGMGAQQIQIEEPVRHLKEEQ